MSATKHQPPTADVLWAGLHRLAAAGLNLAAILPVDELPFDVSRVLADEGVVKPGHCRLVLLGHGGGRFWRTLQTRADTLQQTDHPVDTLSVELATSFARETLDDPGWQLLYPGTTRLPLQLLGAAAGWAHDSPLGLGIHAEYGLWWAYRAALLTTRPLPRLTASPTVSPCSTCTAKPCITACPAAALADGAAIDLVRCSRHRLAEASSCARRCLAREACPVGLEHRYSRAQIHYHYDHSLATVRRYFAHG